MIKMKPTFSTAQLVLFSATILISLVAAQTEKKTIKEIIEELKTCYEADKSKWNDCLLQYVMELRPYLGTGDQAMAIPPMEPTVIDRVVFPPDSALIQGKTEINNLTIRGLGGFNITNVHTNVSAQIVTIKLNFPRLDVTGHYNFDGEMLVLPIKGDGKITLTFEDGVDSILRWYIERDGTGVQLSKVDIKFEAKKIVFHLDNLLGDAEVSEAINNLINDNSQEMIKELKPALTTKLNEEIAKVLAVPVKNLPAEPFILS